MDVQNWVQHLLIGGLLKVCLNLTTPFYLQCCMQKGEWAFKYFFNSQSTLRNIGEIFCRKLLGSRLSLFCTFWSRFETFTERINLIIPESKRTSQMPFCLTRGESMLLSDIKWYKRKSQLYVWQVERSRNVCAWAAKVLWIIVTLAYAQSAVSGLGRDILLKYLR